MTPDGNANGGGDRDDIDEGHTPDCNQNDVPDACDVAEGTRDDVDRNGVPDDCEGCTGDIKSDGILDFRNRLLVLSNWGPCP